MGTQSIHVLHPTHEMQQSQFHLGPPLSCPPLTLEQQQQEQVLSSLEQSNAGMQSSGSSYTPVLAQTLTDRIARLSVTVSDIHKRT